MMFPRFVPVPAIYFNRMVVIRHKLPTMQDCNLGARPYSDMSELKGDIPASYENDPFGQVFQLQELLTGGYVLFSRNAQLSRHRTGGNDNVTTFQHVVSHTDGCGTCKACATVKCFYPSLHKALFAVLGHRIGERAFETHSLCPLNSRAVRANTSLVHPAGPVQHVCRPHEHFLRVASPQGAGAAKRPRIHDGDLPTRGSAFIGDARSPRTSPQYDKIEFLWHDSNPPSDCNVTTYDRLHIFV